MPLYDSEPVLRHSCLNSSRPDGFASSDMWQEWIPRLTSPERSKCQSEGSPGIGRPRRTWLLTLEADLQPHNLGLNSAWRFAQNRGRWQFISECHREGITRKPCCRKETARCRSCSFRFKVPDNIHYNNVCLIF